MGEIILYVDKDFGGLHTHLFDTTPDFTQLSLTGVNTGLPDGVSWNDQVSSFVILSGTWQFFVDVDFGRQQGGDLGPGSYSWIEDYGMDNDAISSVKLISD
jgi:hypothetical protein